MRDEQPYNPLAKKNLGVSVADALLARPVEPLPPLDAFLGAGIYAIYYAGAHPAYGSLAERNQDPARPWGAPIHVGKAVPEGARKGGLGLDIPAGSVLFKRLSEHASSIAQALSLDLDDFRCRYLVVDDIWIPLGESLLIQTFSPVWNTLVDGFGNHDPGSGRYQQRRSSWDILHPGRSWAEKLGPGARSGEEILAAIRARETRA